MKYRYAPTWGWRGARLAGVAAAVASTLVVTTTTAVAGPGGEKGKPESKPAPQETQAQPEQPEQPAAEPQAQSPPPQAQRPPEKTKTKPSPEPQEAQSSPPQAQKQASSDTQKASPAPKSKATPRSSAPKDQRQAAKSPAQSNPNRRGPAGRTTYCHSTRSSTNPFVGITTSNNALPQAHERHHDGDDIIPASGGCPGSTSTGGPGNGNGGGNAGHGPGGKETFCHSTRSSTNPFVVITTSVNALWAHIRHHDGDDIIPATSGDCPGKSTTVTDGPGPGGPDGPNGAGGPDGSGDDNDNGNNGVNGVDGVDGPEGPGETVADDDAPGQRDIADSDVLGTDESGGPAPGGTAPAGPEGGAPDSAGSAPDVAEERAEADEALPFTGRSLGAILVAALLALAIGMVAHRVAGRADA